jgi:ACS family hexuronate transporter-like MFS transporter
MTGAVAPAAVASRPSPTRWSVLWLLGVLFAFSSGDRAILGVLKTTLASELSFSQADYGRLVVALLLPYACMLPFVGEIINRFGARTTLAACLLVISGATALFGAAHGYGQFIVAQVALGLSQAAVAPAVACLILWQFPGRAQASAYSIVNAIQSSATILCPVYVALVASAAGWRWAFLLPAIVGVVFVAWWWQRTVGWTAAPVAIGRRSIAASARALWRNLPARRVVIARAISDPLWFFFQFWQPAYLREHIGLSLPALGRIAWIPPLASVLGVFALSVLSDRLLSRGRATPVTSRIRPLVWAAALAPLAGLLPFVHATALAVALCVVINVVCAVWLSLTPILLGALVPTEVVAPAIGLTNAIGCVAGVLFCLAAGPLVGAFGYTWPFWIGALLYPIAALVLTKSAASATSA